jgi:hypothetical protein
VFANAAGRRAIHIAQLRIVCSCAPTLNLPALVPRMLVVLRCPCRALTIGAVHRTHSGDQTGASSFVVAPFCVATVPTIVENVRSPKEIARQKRYERYFKPE